MGQVAGLQVSARLSLGQSYWALSHHGHAVEVFSRNIEFLQGRSLPEWFGLATIPLVSSHGFLAWSLAELGVFAEGRAHGEDALRLGEAINHPFSLALTYATVGHLYLRQGVLPEAIRVLERGLTLGEARNFPLMSQLCKTQLGAAYALCGRVSEALPLLQQALDQSVASKVTIAYTWRDHICLQCKRHFLTVWAGWLSKRIQNLPQVQAMRWCECTRRAYAARICR